MSKGLDSKFRFFAGFATAYRGLHRTCGQQSDEELVLFKTCRGHAAASEEEPLGPDRGSRWSCKALAGRYDSLTTREYPSLAGDKAFEVAGGKWVACSDVLLGVLVPAVAGKFLCFGSTGRLAVKQLES